MSKQLNDVVHYLEFEGKRGLAEEVEEAIGAIREALEWLADDPNDERNADKVRIQRRLSQLVRL